MRTLLLLGAWAMSAALSAASLFAAEPSFPFQNPDLPLEDRITDLLGRMTLEEKIDCLDTRPDVPRLGVVTSSHIEGYHGVALGGPGGWGRPVPTPTTQFPQAYGLGATWDPELIRQVAAQEAHEARYLFQNPKYRRGGLVVRSPNADLARDPRWGRTEESYGEDPYLTGTLAAAFVHGLQGTDTHYLLTASLTKHFLANSNEDQRESSSSNLDERLWREYYAKPFEMAVGAGAPALMAAYNAVNGTPAHIHPMLRTIVMKEWALNGIISTDGGGLRLLISDHKAFPDLPSAAAACIKAGINQFLDRQKDPVTEAVQRGLLTESEIDQALRGVFRVMIHLGLLDPAERVPYAAIGKSAEEPEPWTLPETKALVRTVTQKSIVLLKNSAGLLPLDKAKIKSIAVVGPRVNDVLLDWYSGTPPYAVSPRAGIENLLGRRSGIAVGWVSNMSDAAIELARQREVAIVCLGNHPESEAGWATVTWPNEGKEGVDRKEIVLQPDQEHFIRRVMSANPRTIVVLLANFPYALPWAAENVTTLLQATHASQELGNALADVIFGVGNPGGKLTQTWPKSLDQLPPMNDYDLRHGRTYMYFEGEPQYPFGYGLSYTTFELSNLRTDTGHLTASGKVVATVDLKNTGSHEGDEVVQLYVRYPESKVVRPKKQLRAFQRVTVAPGQTKPVSLALSTADLAYWSAEQHAWVVEPGRIELLVGNSSADTALKLKTTVDVAPALAP